MSLAKELGNRYFTQSDTVICLATRYYEACFTESGTPLDPDEPSIKRAAAADNLFNHVKDLYEETLGCEIEIKIIPPKD